MSAPDVSCDPAVLCANCGADAEAIDAEGFCSTCGVRRERRGRDYYESVISPRFAGVSDRGRRHYRNEDYLLLKTCGEAEILIVCDGVSTVSAPDVASATAAERAAIALEEAVAESATVESLHMERALALANEAVASIPYPEGSEPPCTTIVSAVLQNGRATVGWCGDSRAYWVDTESVKQITADHALSEDGHTLTRWLGQDALPDAQSEVIEFPIPGPGTLLLCSDGFWKDMHNFAQFHSVFSSLEGDAITKCRALINLSRESGGNDNITLIVCTVDGPTP